MFHKISANRIMAWFMLVYSMLLAYTAWGYLDAGDANRAMGAMSAMVVGVTAMLWFLGAERRAKRTTVILVRPPLPLIPVTYRAIAPGWVCNQRREFAAPRWRLYRVTAGQ